MWLLGRKVREIEMYLPLKRQKILLCFILPTLKALSNYGNSRLKKKKREKKNIFFRSKKMFSLPHEGSFGKTFISESKNDGLKSHITFTG